VLAIVNSALAKVHEDPISSLDEDRRAANIAAIQYPIHRDKLLRLYQWRFATARAVLAPDAAAPEFGMAYKFLLPTDCLKVIGVYDKRDAYRDINYTSGSLVYKVEGRYLLANTNPIYLYYTKRVTDPTQFDSMFSEALAWSLAVDFALSLSNSQTRAELARAELREVIRQARLASAIEASPEVLRGGTWLLVDDPSPVYGFPPLGP
jgi:hypothetical protein